MADNGNDVGGLNARYYFDAQGARLENTNRRLFILTLVLSIMLFVMWIVYESKYKTEVTSIETTQDVEFDGNYSEADDKNN